MSNDRNIEQDRKYWYAKGKWDGSFNTFWIMYLLLLLTIFLTYGGNK
jgi:hypothetical protein